MRVLNVVGARPNFMKMAPIVAEMKRQGERIEQQLVHTGQHYDQQMSRVFFDELGMPQPDMDLGVGSGSHAQQTARVMVEFEKICLAHHPHLVVVVGDVNSTLACTLTAKKLGIAVAHVEAGLRSRDMGMPEEINRLCTDALADLLFTTDREAGDNLRAEGVGEERIHFVGNVMIDTLLGHRRLAESLSLRHSLGLEGRPYATLTLHRPSNVDDRETLSEILQALAVIAEELPIIFPIHPRTQKQAEAFGLNSLFSTGMPVRGLWVTDPLGYLDFLHLNMGAKMVFTDSGGLQEETTVLGIPCLTLRQNTERPITCQVGTNKLVGTRRDLIIQGAQMVLEGRQRPGRVPEKWDGNTAQRIVGTILAHG